ncbi:MAG TPA: MlaD family protein [Burkholderiales bacterium]|jgi:phospholipid/cholesterol/gamma-HCH transport system substrate-binding protein|nr:MlaD family protein [Burkholderiales bacterium]
MDPQTLLKNLPRSMGVKVGMLLAVTILIIGGFIAYVLYARGVFEQVQRIYLIADNAEGVRVGQDLTFAGFPIGTVRRIRLRLDGKVRISVRVPVDEAHWLRESSVFVLDVPVVGATKLRVFSSNLKDPPLADRAERAVLRADTAQEIPQLVASARQILENLDNLTATGSNLQESIRSTRAIIDRMAGKYGVLGGVLGSDENAKKILASIDRANKLLASLDGVALKMDSVLAKTDKQVLGPGGVIDQTQKAVTEVNGILGEVRASLKRVDGILADAQAVATNAKAATADLGTLRAEVEASLRRISGLIDEINRKWPFERETKMKLP